MKKGVIMVPIDFRMTKKGLILLIDSYRSVDELRQDIMKKFADAKDFFSEGDEISLMLTQDTSKPDDIVKIVSLLSDLGVHVKDILVGSMEQKDVKVGQKYDLVREKITEVRGAQIIRRNLRSGQIVVHNYDVVVVGNVHPGAEVIAGGSVVIFGSAKGVLRAGYSQGETGIIAAIDLQPSLIQIGNFLTQEYDHFDGPAVAHVRTGRIVVEEADDVKFEVKGEAS
ncbi:septum site-determining protein MinC [Mesotoga sp.]|uniref:septum site-determining protein MinC n=1 Tax=Mesotoga sp. TaxID=2053577 RepID=UPI00356586FE